MKRRLAQLLLAGLLLFPVKGLANDMALEKKLDDAFAAGELKELHSALVIHKGAILAEMH